MKELMVHVERIVRPVRAMQGRKLRMRRELLGHLQTALEEERGRAADEKTAMAAAKRRLGEEAELTRGLQRSVPVVERVLLAKLPAPGVLERWESRRQQEPGQQNLNHWGGAVLVGIGFVLTWLACAVAVPTSHEQVIAFFMTENEHRGEFLMVFLTIWFITGIGLPVACIGFIESAAVETVRTSRVAGFGILVLGQEMVWMFLVATQVMGRMPGVLEGVRGMLGGATVLVILFMMARQMARLRHPYREWMTLKIAD